MKKLLIILTSAMLFACSSQNVQNGQENVEQIAENNTKEEEDLNNYIDAPFKAESLNTIKIRNGHSLDDYVVGYIEKGDKFEVYETYDDGAYIWNRISSTCWIANDKTWLKRINYGSNINDFIKDISMFYVPNETIENTHYESSTIISNTCHTVKFNDIDGYKCKTMIDSQNVSVDYIDDSFEDYTYDESNTKHEYGMLNPYINIPIGDDCEYIYDDLNRIKEIHVFYYEDQYTKFCFEYNDKGLANRVAEYSQDDKFLINENLISYDEFGRIHSISMNSWASNNAPLYTDEPYLTIEYENNGNLVFINNTKISGIHRTIYKTTDSKIYQIYRFSKNEEETSFEDIKYNY